MDALDTVIQDIKFGRGDEMQCAVSSLGTRKPRNISNRIFGIS
jgi:hypothetical protein